MAPLPIPSPGVRYRIQNVDFRTYVERRAVTDLAMHRMKDGMQQQQWFFREISTGIFEIVDVEDNAYVLEASRSGRGFTPYNERLSPANSQRRIWKLVDSRRGSFYILGNSENNNNSTNYNVFLHCENGDLRLTEDSSLTANSTISKTANYRWYIVEDRPALLADGTASYLIQSLKGDALQAARSAGDSPDISIGNSALGDEHIWETVDLGNGKCTLRNRGVGAFIDAQQVGSNGEWTPVFSTTVATQWDIRKIGGFAHSITIERPDNTNQPVRYALSVLKDIILLKPNKDVQSQMWSISPTALAAFNPPVIPGLTLPVGEYALRSDNGLYIYFDNYNYGELDATRWNYFKFEIVHGNDAAPGQGYVYISLQSSGILAGEKSSMWDHYFFKVSPYVKDVWRIDLVSIGPPKYTITHVVTGYRLQATQGPVNGRNLVTMRTDEAILISDKWSFIPKR